jgi:hypothetical protein
MVAAKAKKQRPVPADSGDFSGYRRKRPVQASVIFESFLPGDYLVTGSVPNADETGTGENSVRILVFFAALLCVPDDLRGMFSESPVKQLLNPIDQSFPHKRRTVSGRFGTVQVMPFFPEFILRHFLQCRQLAQY